MMWLIFASLAGIFTLATSDHSDAIMFPNEDTSSFSIPTVTERIATDTRTTPKECPKNMVWYDGADVLSEGICECNARFLYFQPNDTCYEAYKQGPCSPQNYFILPPGGGVPRCEHNPCIRDDLVPYNSTCSKIASIMGPCPPTQYLMVNSTTFQLECQTLNVGELHIIDVPANRCPNGSRRNALGQCRKMI